MTRVYALIPAFASPDLWQDEPLLRLLAEFLANTKQELHGCGIELILVEPSRILSRTYVVEALTLMELYCSFSDCLISFDSVHERYPSPLIGFMCSSARERGLPIITADCALPHRGTAAPLPNAISTLVGRLERHPTIGPSASFGSPLLAKLVAIDPSVEHWLNGEPQGTPAVSVPTLMRQGYGAGIRFSKLPGSFAREVTSISCARATPEDIAAIRLELDAHKLLIFRDQDLAPADQIRFTKFFGRPDMAWDNRNRADDEPRIQIISNQYKGGDYHYERSRRMSTVRYWHADTSFLDNPTRYTFLSVQKVPTKYGLSEFINTKLAYEALPDDFKALARDKTVCHSFNYIFGELLRQRNDERRDPVPDVRHPLVWCGKTGDCLYLSELSQAYIIGLPASESDKLITQLMEHCKQLEFRHTHVWRPGDFLVWDNIGIMHRGGFADPEYERVLHRTTVTIKDAAHAESLRQMDSQHSTADTGKALFNEEGR